MAFYDRILYIPYATCLPPAKSLDRFISGFLRWFQYRSRKYSHWGGDRVLTQEQGHRGCNLHVTRVKDYSMNDSEGVAAVLEATLLQLTAPIL